MIIALILIGVWLEINNWKFAMKQYRDHRDGNYVIRTEKGIDGPLYYETIDVYANGKRIPHSYDKRTGKKLY